MKGNDRNRAINAEAIASDWGERACLTWLRRTPEATLQNAGATVSGDMDGAPCCTT